MPTPSYVGKEDQLLCSIDFMRQLVELHGYSCQLDQRMMAPRDKRSPGRLVIPAARKLATLSHARASSAYVQMSVDLQRQHLIIFLAYVIQRLPTRYGHHSLDVGLTSVASNPETVRRVDEQGYELAMAADGVLAFEATEEPDRCE